MTNRLFSLLFLAIAWNSSSFGQDKFGPIERGPSREPQPFVFDLKALKNAPASFSTDYPAFYIHAATSYLLDADGTVECTTHEVIRLNNRKGIDALGEHRHITYTPAHDKLILNEARLIKSDGRRIEVDAKHLQLRDVAIDYFVYDARKELIISFPGLEAGDVIDVRWTTRGKNPEYAGHYFTRYHFGDDQYPICQEAFHVRLPAGKTLKHALINPHLLANPKMTPTIVEEKDAKTFTWRDGNLLPIVKEDHLPSREERRPGIAISTFANWEEVAQWERQTRAACGECIPELKQIVERVKREHKSPEAITRALTDWVRTNIRYVSTSDRHDFTPHAPAVVCKNRYGDCKDSALMLAVMLKEAGIPCGFVSLSPRGDGQIIAEVPSPWSTHAILYVPIDGKDHWIDTTAARAKWDFLPYSDRDRVAYIVDDKTIRLTRTPSFTAADNKTVTVTRMTFQKNGTSHNERTIDSYGEAALMKRESWSDLSAKERRRLIRGELLEQHSRARLGETLEIDEKSVRDGEEPVRLKLSYDVPDHFHGEGFLSGHISDNSLWSAFLSVTVDPERESAIELKEPFEAKHRFEIEAPKDFRLGDLPDDEEVRSKWGTFTIKFDEEKRGRRWIVEFHTRLERTRITKAELEEFRTFQDEIQDLLHVAIVMKAIGDD